MRLAIGEKLLIMQTATTILKPWGYIIRNLSLGAVVKNASGITANYIELDVDSSNGFDRVGFMLS